MSNEQMTDARCLFFLERFKRDEKMLGPNEQAALDYAMSRLRSSAERVGTLSVQHFRGERSGMVNHDFDYTGNLPSGTYAVYLAPPPAATGAQVPALEVFRIAGGDVECSPSPTAEQALECLRNLRECYDEETRHYPTDAALARPAAEGE